MKVPSLSRGCEIAQFFVRHTAAIIRFCQMMGPTYHPTI